MEIKQIYSNRNYVQWPSAHLVHEWEEDFSKVLNVPIVSSRSREIILDNWISRKVFSKNSILNILKKLDDLFSSEKKALLFEMLPKSHFSYSTGTNIVPIIIDFWNRQDPESFYRIYENCKLVGISSREVYSFLKKNNCPLEIIHLPLSLPDRYRLNGTESFIKKYDIILAGRRNEILWEYLHVFSEKYSETEFLYQENIKGRLFYVSNKNGIIGEFQQRAEYINLLKACKVGFYATPGMDGAKETGGFNPVTPRFLELVAAGCHIIGRYPDNEDTKFYNMECICPSITNYDQFEALLLQYLKGARPCLNFYSGFLEPHYTSKRACLLKDILNKTN